MTSEASLRIADYSWSRTNLVKSYKTGLAWKPVYGDTLHANYAHSQRAPTITELLSPPRGDFDTYVDICEGLTADSNSPGHENCRLDPVFAAQFAADPAFKFEDENNLYSPSSGNPEWFKETADAVTFGITLDPEFIDGLQVAVDYYEIQIDDAISPIDNGIIINQCYNSNLAFGEGNPFCNDITRDDDGNIIEIQQRPYNFDAIRTRGLDVAVAYDYDEPLDENGNGGYFPENDAACAAGEDSCIENPEAPKFYKFDEYINHSLSVSYIKPLATQSELRLFGGVNNIFNEKGGFKIRGHGNFHSEYGGGMGRFYYLGAEMNF